jgi:cytochrome c oxidase subunit II
MNVELYERIWMWAASVLILLFLGTIIGMSAVQAVSPQSHLETIDPASLATNPEFSAPGVKPGPGGGVIVSVVAETFDFSPNPIEVPANRPVTFRLTSADVIHGFEVAGTNANAMAIPGYVSQFTVTFPKPGEYLIACNEYCGLLHHNMVAKLIVKKEAP